jgi:hypothetical protein
MRLFLAWKAVAGTRDSLPPTSAEGGVMSANTALIQLIRDALRDRSIRDEIKAIVANDPGDVGAASPETEPLIHAHAAGKLLGMSAADVRAAAFRGQATFAPHRSPSPISLE